MVREDVVQVAGHPEPLLADPPPRLGDPGPPCLGPALLGDPHRLTGGEQQAQHRGDRHDRDKPRLLLPADHGADEQVDRQAERRHQPRRAPPAGRDGDHRRDGEAQRGRPEPVVQRVVRGRRGEVAGQHRPGRAVPGIQQQRPGAEQRDRDEVDGPPLGDPLRGGDGRGDLHGTDECRQPWPPAPPVPPPPDDHPAPVHPPSLGTPRPLVVILRTGRPLPRWAYPDAAGYATG
ncbi:hypothetical protein GCM10027610_010940 [Dactylosporangium cerinum]